jgi:hypothetical protein
VLQLNQLIFCTGATRTAFHRWRWRLIGWAWFAASVAALYFFVRAILYDGSWWSFFGSVAIAWLLYRVALYYQLQKEHELVLR